MDDTAFQGPHPQGDMVEFGTITSASGIVTRLYRDGRGDQLFVGDDLSRSYERIDICRLIGSTIRSGGSYWLSPGFGSIFTPLVEDQYGRDVKLIGNPWVVIDPSAPSRPADPAAVERGEPLDRGMLRRLGCRSETSFVAVTMLLLMTVMAIKMAGDPLHPLAKAGAGVLGLITIFVVAKMVAAGVSSRRHSKSKLEIAQQSARVQEWERQYEIRQDELEYCSSVEKQADRLVVAVAALEMTRAYCDGWVDEGWARALRVRRWSLVSRLRDSISVRDDLVAASKLTQLTSDMERLVAEKLGEIRELDAEVESTIDQIQQLTKQARELDTALDEADRADAIGRRLGATSSTVDELEAEHRRLRDQALVDAPEGDLSILGAGLGALVRHFSDKG